MSSLTSHSRRFWVIFDLVLNILAFIGAAWLSPHSWTLIWSEVWVSAGVYAFCFGITSLGMGYYEREHRFFPRTFLTVGVASASLALIATLAVIFFTLYWKVGRYSLIFGTLGSYVVLSSYRLGVWSLIGRVPYRFAILGEPSAITQEIRVLSDRKSRSGIRYTHVDGLEQWMKGYDRYSQSEIRDELRKFGLADLVLTESARRDPHTIDLSIRAMQSGIRVMQEIDFYGEVFGRLPTRIISENWLLFSGINVNRDLIQVVKRGFDLSFSAFLLIILFPFMLLIAALIRITSPGPVLFLQDREGIYGIPFRILKFRTMVAQPKGDHPPSTRERDPRVTTIGRILRPLHLDELPQLWNIFRGDMSFVGPRPEVYSFTQEITKEVPIYRFRTLVRPGLTGLSQISVGYTLDNAEATLVKLSYDLYYVKYNSFSLDLVILLRTIFVLTRGAH